MSRKVEAEYVYMLELVLYVLQQGRWDELKLLYLGGGGVTPFLGMKMQLNKENPGKYKGNSIVVELEHKCLARVFHSTKTKSVPIQML